ncbi:MAG: ATP-binding protein [Nitrososphaerota archaeon]|jgi:predicted AAA+ superfamily ATPase|nr:ATP-binding protein [Nitrososphaerota archaeon]MDG6935727.1 ATP-binding protein [Nitrososphaerota archaeon]MDG6943795.1 ATP-binding protein [Nitrososphaerota archaeon]
MDVDEHLRLLNRWWIDGSVKSELAKEYRRICFTKIFDAFQKYRQAVILTGLRRVGKSTLMYQTIDELIRRGVKPANIMYFTMDLLPLSDEGLSLTDVLNSYQKITGTSWKNDRVYLFIDEVQKLRNWGNAVKIIYDAFPNLRFMISGSASLNLERTAMDALAGRHFLYDVPVLSPVEYYSIKYGINVENPRMLEGEIIAEIEPYIRKPFPELVGVDDFARISEYIRESIISKIIGMDLISEFGKVNLPLLHSLLEIFFSEPGMLLNVDSLSKSLGRRKQDVELHIYMLEYSKLIRIIKNYRPSAVSESRKMRKVYPYDISLALSYYPSLERGKVIESLALSRLEIRRYWREGRFEVDGLLENGTPVEVKSSQTVREEHLSGLERFLEKYGRSDGLLVYSGNEFKSGKVRGVNVNKMLLYGI